MKFRAPGWSACRPLGILLSPPVCLAVRTRGYRHTPLCLFSVGPRIWAQVGRLAKPVLSPPSCLASSVLQVC